MHRPEAWGSLLEIEPEFLQLERRIRAGEIDDFNSVPPEAFAWHAWDLIEEARLFEMMLPFLRWQVERAARTMPEIYARNLQAVRPAELRSPADWHRIPPLVKDDDADLGLRGFRELAARNPGVLRPNDLQQAAAVFGSGGSLGRYTPNYLTRQDREREVQAWRRGHDYHGLTAGDRALYTYNTTHKGGQWMQESLWQHGVEVFLRRPEEGPRRVLENLRDYEANVLFTVQQPYESLQSQAKAAGINLHSLVMVSLENPELRGILIPDENGRKQIEFVFLGGFEIVPYARELVDEYLDGTPIATLLGSSEAIPQACSTNPRLTPGAACHFNQLHLLQGPHYVEVLKPGGGSWIPVEKGEEGLLVYTSWARDGTIWIRYAPGDVATRVLDEGECPCGLRSPVIAGVRRKNISQREQLLLDGCAAG